MGQQHQKITIQKIDSPIQVHRARKIFPNNYKVSTRHDQKTKCDRPRCRCPSEHVVRQNLKLCEVCSNPSAPTVRKNNKLSYQDTVVYKEHQPTWEYQSVYKEGKIIEKQEPVYYYNGWGLPTQKCYVDAVIRELPPNLPPPAVTRPQPTRPTPIPQQPMSPPFKPPILIENPPKPIPINIEQVDIRNRMQNLFLFP